jgi:hypothetical protein
MSEIALARINSFGISPKADFESTSEEAVFIKVCQLQEIINKALQPLQDAVREDSCLGSHTRHPCR